MCCAIRTTHAACCMLHTRPAQGISYLILPYLILSIRHLHPEGSGAKARIESGHSHTLLCCASFGRSSLGDVAVSLSNVDIRAQVASARLKSTHLHSHTYVIFVHSQMTCVIWSKNTFHPAIVHQLSAVADCMQTFCECINQFETQTAWFALIWFCYRRVQSVATKIYQRATKASATGRPVHVQL
jgi:hypothetical protein